MKAISICVVLLFANVAFAEDPAGAKELFGGGINRKVVGLKEEKRASPPNRKKKPKKEIIPSFGLSCWIELQSPGGERTPVVHTRTFKSGEKIRLHFTGNTDGYIAIVQFAASGNASVLFPDAKRRLVDNAIRAGADHILPSEKDWFKFDHTPGTEQLLVLFAKTREELDHFVETEAFDFQSATHAQGSKDLVIETVDDEATYAVNRAGELIVMQLALVHQ